MITSKGLAFWLVGKLQQRCHHGASRQQYRRHRCRKAIRGLRRRTSGRNREPADRGGRRVEHAWCPATGLTNEMTAPRAAPCTAGLGLGAKRTVRQVNAAQGVQIAAVAAEHPNELSSAFIADPERTDLSANGLGAYVGLANGFVITFTNGLRAYLSGDTGLTSDMRTVVGEYYGPGLAVINIGDIFTTGPEEAAFAITDYIAPASVIPSHVNEAATQGGVAVEGSKTARFQELVAKESGGHGTRARGGRNRIAVHLPLSGITMDFDAKGRCVAGCEGN